MPRPSRAHRTANATAPAGGGRLSNAAQSTTADASPLRSRRAAPLATALVLVGLCAAALFSLGGAPARAAPPAPSLLIEAKPPSSPENEEEKEAPLMKESLAAMPPSTVTTTASDGPSKQMMAGARRRPLRAADACRLWRLPLSGVAGGGDGEGECNGRGISLAGEVNPSPLQRCALGMWPSGGTVASTSLSPPSQEGDAEEAEEAAAAAAALFDGGGSSSSSHPQQQQQQPFFSQVWSPHIGRVPPSLIDATLRDIAAMARLFGGVPQSPAETASEAAGAITAAVSKPIGLPPLPLPRRLVLFAVDGTLLNMLRWGRVQNDNDVDVGFYFLPTSAGADNAASGATTAAAAAGEEVGGAGVIAGADADDSRYRPPPFHTMDQYYTMLDALAAAGIIHSPSRRDRRRLHSSTESVPAGKCRHRGQLMQCRHKSTGVYIDLFGPDTLFSKLSRLSLYGQILPLRQCRSFGAEFPCPNRPAEVLTSLALDLSGGSKGQDQGDGAVADAGAKASNEFEGCSLFPRNASEQSAGHLRQILASGRLLRACGYPTLLPLPPSINKGAVYPRECREIMERAGVHV